MADGTGLALDRDGRVERETEALRDRVSSLSGAMAVKGTPMHHHGANVGSFLLGRKDEADESSCEDKRLPVLFASQTATELVNAVWGVTLIEHERAVFSRASSERFSQRISDSPEEAESEGNPGPVVEIETLNEFHFVEIQSPAFQKGAIGQTPPGQGCMIPDQRRAASFVRVPFVKMSICAASVRSGLQGRRISPATTPSDMVQTTGFGGRFVQYEPKIHYIYTFQSRNSLTIHRIACRIACTLCTRR